MALSFSRILALSLFIFGDGGLSLLGLLTSSFGYFGLEIVLFLALWILVDLKAFKPSLMDFIEICD